MSLPVFLQALRLRLVKGPDEAGGRLGSVCWLCDGVAESVLMCLKLRYSCLKCVLWLKICHCGFKCIIVT